MFLRKLIIGLIAFPLIAFGAVMQSTSYKIDSDSINVGGTENSISSNYTLSDTVGEVGTGNSTSVSYNLYAGYRSMTGAYVAISAPADVTMSPAINGLTGGTSNGQAAWTITTDAPGGYTLAVKASTNPALKSSNDSFADYTPVSGAVPDFAFSIATTDSEFGFTPEGSDIVQKYKDNFILLSCNTGSSDTANSCWYNFSTTDETISQSTAANNPTGTMTTVKMRSQSGTSHIQTSGTYTATITATATAL
jgi:hypothetical protein